MPRYSQNDRMMEVKTPLGQDALLLEQFHGQEAMSDLFSFDLDMLEGDGSEVDFSAMLGQSITVKIRVLGGDGLYRYFNGICIRMGDVGAVSGAFGAETFRRYTATIVPKLWVLSRQTDSRIFQHITIPDILTKVLQEQGIEFKNNISGNFDQRDYVAQYRETNLAFISRLMEEEGIYYYFEHSDGKHVMVLGNESSSCGSVPNGAKLTFSNVEGETRDKNTITSWVKSQEVRSGKVVQWDHHFGMAHRNHESVETIQDTVTVGKVSHKLTSGGGGKLELYDFPGGFAQRYDGIDKGGGEKEADLGKIKPDGTRTVKIRQQQEAAQAMRINGTSLCPQMLPGFTFTMQDHGVGDGDYLLTSVQHHAVCVGVYTGDDSGSETYQNSFGVSPKQLPFRPAQKTPKPLMIGTTTAVVVGPSGSEIFTDKHGRVKVQFHWDRKGQSDANSSCWVRVATLWAGTNWGMVHVPRIKQEVVVAFEEGDPDRPIIVGSVYNSRETPPYKLPDNMTQFGFKSRSSPGGGSTNYNELRFEDKKGKEHIMFHAEKDFTRVVENNDIEVIGYKTLEDSNIKTSKVNKQDQATEVYNDRFEQIGVSSGKGNLTTIIEKNLTTTLNKGDETHTIKKGSRIVKIRKHDKLTIEKGDQTLKINKGSRKAEIFGNDSLKLKTGSQETKIQLGNQTTKVSLGKIDTSAMQKITLKVGPSKIEISPAGIKLDAPMITIKGKAMAKMEAAMVQVQGKAMTMIKGGIVMIN